jgi:hypothetical protein
MEAENPAVAALESILSAPCRRSLGFGSEAPGGQTIEDGMAHHVLNHQRLLWSRRVITNRFVERHIRIRNQRLGQPQTSSQKLPLFQKETHIPSRSPRSTDGAARKPSKICIGLFAETPLPRRAEGRFPSGNVDGVPDGAPFNGSKCAFEPDDVMHRSSR